MTDRLPLMAKGLRERAFRLREMQADAIAHLRAPRSEADHDDAANRLDQTTSMLAECLAELERVTAPEPEPTTTEGDEADA